MEKLTKEKIIDIKAFWLNNKLIDELLTAKMNKKIKETKNEDLGEYFNFKFLQLKAGEEVLDDLINLIFTYNKENKYIDFDIEEVREYCDSWYFDCIHDAPLNYNFNDIIRLIKEMITGVLDYDEEGAFSGAK